LGYLNSCPLNFSENQNGLSLKGVERIKKLENLFALMIKTSPSFMAVLRGPDYVFEQYNDQYAKLISHRDALGKPLVEALPEFKNQGFLQTLDRVRTTKEPFIGTEVLVQLQIAPGEPMQKRYVDFVYQAYDIEPGVERVFIHGVDVTDKVRARDVIENERQNFRDLFRQTPEMVCILSGPEHRFEFVNDSHIKALGFDATGMTVREAQPESIEIYDLLDGVYHNGITAELHETPVTLGDRIRFFNLTYSARRDKRGRINGVMILGIEVSEQLEDRFRLAASEKRLGDVLDTIPIYAGLLNRDGELTLVNEMAVQSVNLPKSAVLGKKYWEGPWWKPIPGRPEVIQNAHAEAFLGKTQRFDTQYATEKDGEIELRWADLSMIPIKTEKGLVRDVNVTGFDVTDRVDLQRDLLQAKAEADRANESKSRFLANMSHEIRTPLAAIMGFSELLRSEKSTDAGTKSYVERILRNSLQLGRLIDELLDLSKIEADKLEIERSEVDVEALIEDVFSTQMLRAQEKGLEFKFSWNTEYPKYFVTDSVRLSQILTNIVGNAVKFTEAGSIKAEFSILKGQTSKIFRARIEDTGIGLSAEQQRRIFEPFMQADSSVTRKYGGTGLGLALSKKLALLLGGNLFLERSELGKGSVFRIEVPILESKENFSQSQKSSSDEAPSADALKGRKILVVDDAIDNRTIVSLFLRNVGAGIEEATNGEEAIKMLTEKTYDLVLMDIQMPILDGYQAFIRAREMGYEAPIVALTAYAFKAERDRCLQSGFNSYITKPINRANLIKTVVEIVNSH
jgi:signal transduction histidine kinase/BarA-like signal transduction histidine kinase